MGRIMQLASFSMAEVTYATGDISYLVQEQAKSASFKVRAKQENVSGVLLPGFEVERVSGSGEFCFQRIYIALNLCRFQSDRSWAWWTASFES